MKVFENPCCPWSFKGKNVLPFLYRQEVKSVLTARRETLLNLYFKKQKAETILSRNFASLCYGSGGHSKQFPFPDKNSPVLFELNFIQLFYAPPAISNLDFVIISSAAYLVTFQKVSSCYLGTFRTK